MAAAAALKAWEAHMTADKFNRFCGSLPHAHHVVQWGGSDVWKIADKVFAIGGWNEGGNPGVSFKCSEVAFEMLKDQPGLRPAPYLASRGMSWLQRTDSRSLKDAGLKDSIRESYRLVSLGLPKKVQKQLGLNQDTPTAVTSRPSKSSPQSPRGKA